MPIEGYSERFVSMASSADRYKVLPRPDGGGSRSGDCGDRIEFYLAARSGKVRQLTFQVSGCINTFACANAVSHLVEGKSVAQCWELSAQDVIDFLETLSEDHRHCAELVVEALYQTLVDYHKRLREPWRCDYSRP